MSTTRRGISPITGFVLLTLLTLFAVATIGIIAVGITEEVDEQRGTADAITSGHPDGSVAGSAEAVADGPEGVDATDCGDEGRAEGNGEDCDGGEGIGSSA